MSDEKPPSPDPKNPGMAFIWLLVGLAPILILLGMASNPPSFSKYIFLACAVCNLMGGIGCLRGLKDPADRVIFGFLLGVFFFVLSWGIVLYQACSHMNL